MRGPYTRTGRKRAKGVVMSETELADVEPRFGEEQPPPQEAIFQEARELRLDETDQAEPGVATVVGGGGDPRVAEALRYAGAELQGGVCEEGTNGGVPLTRYVKWFGAGLPASPWCAFFVSWCWDNATDRNHKTPWDNPGWVPSIHAWAKAHGKLIDRPEQGALFGVRGEHIGWVLTPGGSSFTTIEGNASGCVRSYRRNTSGLWMARIA